MSLKQTARILAPMWLMTITMAAFTAPLNPGAALTNIAQIRALSDADTERQPEARFVYTSQRCGAMRLSGALRNTR